MAKLDMRNGTEGPRHDPYSFIEYIFEGEQKVTLHLGLAEWVAVDGKKLGVPDPVEMFKVFTTFSPHQFEKAYQKLHGPKQRCPHCSGKSFDWVSGYPRESLQICSSCENIVYCDFNESAIL